MTKPADKVAELLAQYPGPVRLSPSRLKLALVFLVGAAFAVGGGFMIADGQGAGWFVAIFFAAVAVIAVVVMLPGAGHLVLDANGFEARTMYRSLHHRWDAVADFSTARIPPSNNHMVVYDDVTADESMTANLNRSITGRNAALSDTFGLNADDLAALMTQWRERALR